MVVLSPELSYNVLLLVNAVLRQISCQRHGLAVPRAGDRSYVTGSINSWSRSHLTHVTGVC